MLKARPKRASLPRSLRRGRRVAVLLAWCSAGLLTVPALHADGVPAQRVLGNWLTQDRDGIIQISVTADGSYQGRIVGGTDPERLDVNNPDPALRSERLQGHVIMQGMRYIGDGHWSTGTIRDPNNGHIYKCRLQLLSVDRLQVRGFLGISLLGRSQVWTRFIGKSLDLRPGH